MSVARLVIAEILATYGLEPATPEFIWPSGERGKPLHWILHKMPDINLSLSEWRTDFDIAIQPKTEEAPTHE